MTGFDIAVLCLIGLSALLGVWRGLAREVFGIAAWVGGLVGAVWGSGPLGELVLSGFTQPARSITATVLAFIAGYVVVSVVGLILSHLLRKGGLGPVDRGLGLMFGGLRGLLVAVMLVLVGGMTAWPKEAWWRGALTASTLESLALQIKPLLPPSVAERIAYPKPPNSPSDTSSAKAS